MKTIILMLALTASFFARADEPAVPPARPSLVIYVDVLSIHDIDGPVDGVYPDVDAEVTRSIIEDVTRALAGRAIITDIWTVNGLNVQSGLTIAEDDKDSGKPFVATYSSNFPQEIKDLPWPIQLVFSARDNGKRDPEPVPHYVAPDSVKAINADYVLLLHAQARRVPTSKALGVGIASGLVTGLVTGFNTFVTLMPRNGGHASLALVNTRTGAVEWFQQRATKTGMQELSIYRLVNVLQRDARFAAQPAPDAPAAPTSIYEAKLAYREGRMSKDQFQQLADQFKSTYESEKVALEQQLARHEISEPLFDARVSRLQTRLIGP